MQGSVGAKGLIHACDQAEGPGPLADIATRELAEVGTSPLILHAISRLTAAGLSEIGIVADPRVVDAVRSVVDSAPAPRADITYLPCDSPCSTGEALRSARDFSESGALVLHAGDALVLEDLAPLLDAFLDHELATMLVRPMESGARRDRAHVAASGEPSRFAVPDRPALLHILGPRVLATLEEPPPAGDADPLRSALSRLDAGDARVETRWIDGFIVRDPMPASLLAANRRVLDEVTRAPLHGGSRSSSTVEVQGPVIIDPRARVETSTIRGPAIIAAGAHVSDSYVGPYSSVGHDVRLIGVELDNSIVMTGAAIRDFGARIESSVIGRRCRIERDFRLPRAVRLELGDAARLVVS